MNESFDTNGENDFALRAAFHRRHLKENPPRPVKDEDIENLLDGALNEFMKDDVTLLVSSYRLWNEAYRRILSTRHPRDETG